MDMGSGSLHTAELLWFGGLFFLASDTIFASLYRNSYLDIVWQVRDNGYRYYPGTDRPIIVPITHLNAWDILNKLGLVFFANIFDGSTPALSFFAIQFAGCLLPLLTVIMLEGKRVGNKGTILSWSPMWGMLLQFPGFGVVMPIYALCHLRFSKTAATRSEGLRTDIRPRSMGFLQCFIPSLILMYLIPTVLVTLPLPSSFHQQALALWQGFPLWFYLLQTISVFILPWLLSRLENSEKSLKGSRVDRAATIWDMEPIFKFAFTVSATVHLATLTLIYLYPYTFFYKHSWAPHISFRNVFLPRAVWNVAKMNDPGAATLNMFKYDQLFGTISSISWALLLWTRSQPLRPAIGDVAVQVAKMLALSVVVGPGATLAYIIRTRDAQLAYSHETSESKTL